MTDRLERLWAGWRGDYVRATASADLSGEAHECVLCAVMAELDSVASVQVVHRGDLVEVLLNAYPYNNGHMLVLPKRHTADLDQLDKAEHSELWDCVTDGVRALKLAYETDGINVGVNQGRAAGAGIPGHIHVHVLPRWSGDTSFATAVAGTRIVPESLEESSERLRLAWPVT